MSKKSIAMVVITATIVLGNCLIASASSYDIRSSGRIVFDNGTSDPSDDVIFDASDFETLKRVCE